MVSRHPAAGLSWRLEDGIRQTFSRPVDKLERRGPPAERGSNEEGGMDKVQEWNELAAQLAVDSIRASTQAGSGHPTSSMSAAHLLAVLYADHLRYDASDPKMVGIEHGE